MASQGEPADPSFPRGREHRSRRRAALRHADRVHGPRAQRLSQQPTSQRLSALYDTHCHLDFEALDDDREGVLQRAFEAGVREILVPGVDLAQWTRAEVLARCDPARARGVQLRFAVGLHPRYEGDPTQVEAWVARLGAVAIGELGWDRAAPFDDVRADVQLDLARSRDLPVVLHIVGAHGHALERLRRHGSLRGVVHAFSGSAGLVREYTRLGLHISIGPSVLRANAKKVLAAAREVPEPRLLLETDAPDQTAEPHDVRRVVAAVAQLRGSSEDALARVTTENARALFGSAR